MIHKNNDLGLHAVVNQKCLVVEYPKKCWDNFLQKMSPNIIDVWMPLNDSIIFNHLLKM